MTATPSGHDRAVEQEGDHGVASPNASGASLLAAFLLAENRRPLSAVPSPIGIRLPHFTWVPVAARF